MQSLTSAFMWISAIGTGLMAGVYFTFSAFVMGALGNIAPAAGIAAMQSINAVILRSAFMPLFFGTTVISLALAVLGVLRWQSAGAPALVLAGILYVVGMFVVTAAFNVPLNNRLAAADPSSPEGLAEWHGYLKDWTRWNHVRTAASTLAAALYVAAIARGGL